MSLAPPSSPAFRWLMVEGLLALCLAARPGVAGAQQDAGPLVRWARVHAVPIATVDSGPDGDLVAVGRMIGAARVVALGEPAHGAHEPLAFRNRLFRYLVRERGFTAIAIESGLSESRRIQDVVAGGAGDVGRIVRDNLTWGFGGFGENLELVRWMRRYNADPAHRRKVRFYGMDLSLAGPGGSTPTPLPLEAALSYLARVDSASARRLRARLAPFLSRLPGLPSAALSSDEHDRLTGAIEDLVALLQRDRPRLIAATSPADYAWGLRNAVVARQADDEFRVVPPDLPGGGIPPAAWRAVSARDAAMAANVAWVLRQEGPEGRVLVFAHDAHVKSAPTVGGGWSAFQRPPDAMGMYLRSRLGSELFILGTGSAADGPGLPPVTPDPAGVDAALARVGMPRFVVDLRDARDPQVVAWLRAPHPMRANFTTFVTLAPAAAFDALLYLDRLTPAHAP